MNRATFLSHDVRIWSVERYKGARGATYTVRWHVAGNSSQRTFTTSKLADAFRAQLLVAAQDGQQFDVGSGLPRTMLTTHGLSTWLELAMEYARMKWSTSSPRHRKGTAEALVTLTMALTHPTPGA